MSRKDEGEKRLIANQLPSCKSNLGFLRNKSIFINEVSKDRKADHMTPNRSVNNSDISSVTISRGNHGGSCTQSSEPNTLNKALSTGCTANKNNEIEN